MFIILRKSVVYLLTFFRKLLGPKSCYRSLLQCSWKCQESYFFLSWSMGAAHKSSCPKVFFKRGALNIFAKFTRKFSLAAQLYQKADCNIYSIYHYYLKHQIIEFFFWSSFLFIYWSFSYLLSYFSSDYNHANTFWLLSSFYFSLSLNKLPQLVFFF